VTVLAIYNLKGNEALLARQLAAVLHKTVYEANSRVRAPGGGPSVIGSFASAGPAHDTANLLRDRGFDTLLLDEPELEADARRFVVRDYRFGPDAMQLEARDGRLEVGYAAVELLLRGVVISRRDPAVAPAGRTVRKFSLTRAALSGGLILTKAVPAPRLPAVEEREGFLHLYARGLPPVAWRESELRYHSSQGVALLPSRHANFTQLVAELRRRCPRAAFDERLASRAGQAQLLGPSLSPDRHLDVAISVLAGALRRSPDC
jgi:hypothetical protein